MIYRPVNWYHFYKYLLPRRVTEKHVYRWLFWIWTPYVKRWKHKYIRVFGNGKVDVE